MIEIDRTDLGHIKADEAAVIRLVERAAERVEGVHAVQGRRGIRLTVEQQRDVVVSIGIVARAGIVLPELGHSVQERVSEVLTTVLEPTALRVDVTIEEIAG